jgi:hypothetical protein
MIEIINKSVNQENGEISVSLKPQPIKKGVIKLTRHQVADIISSTIEVGELVGGQTVCNKVNFPTDYTFTFKPLVKKEKKIIDKPKEPVMLKKTRTRKPKTTGG